jgi:hypothetical protein
MTVTAASTGVRPRGVASPSKKHPLASPSAVPPPLSLSPSSSRQRLPPPPSSNNKGHASRPWRSLVRPSRVIVGAVTVVCSLSVAIQLHSVALLDFSTTTTADRVLFQQPVIPLQWDIRGSRRQQQQPSHEENRRQLLTILSDVGYERRPRVVGCFWPPDYDDDDNDDNKSEEEEEEKDKKETKTPNKNTSKEKKKKPEFISLMHMTMNPNWIMPLQDRNIYWSLDQVKAQLRLENSKDYDSGAADPFEHDDCVRQYDWQVTSYPTCNQLHEYPLWDMTTSSSSSNHNNEETTLSKVKYLASGYWRDTWMIRDMQWQPHALKTMRYMHEYEQRNYDRHRRDAVAMEHMTSSPNVLDIYAFCGNSGVFEFADGGSLEDSIWYSEEKEWNSTEKLIVAYQAVSGLADLHNIDVEGRASIAHTDIVPSQFVFVNTKGRFLLNDFNRCRFIRWNQKENIPCPFHVGSNPGTVRIFLQKR